MSRVSSLEVRTGGVSSLLCEPWTVIHTRKCGGAFSESLGRKDLLTQWFVTSSRTSHFAKMLCVRIPEFPVMFTRDCFLDAAVGAGGEGWCTPNVR